MNDFHLKGEDDSFKAKTSDIYSCFDTIKNNSQLKYSKESEISRKRKGKSRGQVEPGFKTEPDKWVKYSLESTEVANDRQNTQAALSFLHELSKRSKPEKIDDKAAIVNVLTSNEVDDMDTNADKKVAFKKPLPHLMSEHVVGKSKSKTYSIEKSNKETLPSFDKVELYHLEENVSAVEYQADIEAKLEETLQLQKNNTSPDISNNLVQNTSNHFKSNKLHSSKRNIRKRN